MPDARFRAARAAAVLAMALAAAGPLHAQRRHEGVARTAAGTGVLYRETHWLYSDAGVPARLVLYRCAGGEAFARKRVREQPSATAPSFDFVDARSGYREGVRERDGRREVYWQAGAASPVQARVLDAAAGTVIDAGFDAYVRQRWTQLGDVRGHVVPFLVPSRLRTYDFRIAGGEDAREGTRAVRRLRMTLAAWFGFAVPDLRLTYDVRERRLLRFEGIGSIRDARGGAQPVRIDFPDPPVAADRAEIDAAARQRLVARCA